MVNINEKLNKLKMEFNSRKIKIMIIGLGSVGNYLLDYLMSLKDENIEIAVVGRNKEKMTSDVNIIRVSSMIRNQNRTTIKIFSDVNLEDVDSIKDVILDNEPDIIVNSSRAYSGLKYGSISWKNIRAYGIWTPLAIRYTKNIMEAYKLAGSKAIVINTSYSDAVIPWLKSADKLYPVDPVGVETIIPSASYTSNNLPVTILRNEMILEKPLLAITTSLSAGR